VTDAAGEAGTEGKPPIADLIRQFDEEIYYGDERRAAEFAYALAIRLREVGDLDRARDYAARCLDLTLRLRSKTLEDVASDRTSVGGVPLPELFHDGVVRARLADLLAE
jgi:hypothetical protein